MYSVRVICFSDSKLCSIGNVCLNMVVSWGPNSRLWLSLYNLMAIDPIIVEKFWSGPQTVYKHVRRASYLLPPTVQK